MKCSMACGQCRSSACSNASLVVENEEDPDASNERHERGDAIEVFKYVKGFLDVERETLFITNSTEYPKTRHQQTSMPLTVPRANLD